MTLIKHSVRSGRIHSPSPLKEQGRSLSSLSALNVRHHITNWRISSIGLREASSSKGTETPCLVLCFTWAAKTAQTPSAFFF